MKFFHVLAAGLIMVTAAASPMQRDSVRNPERAEVGKLGQVRAGTIIYSGPDVGSRVVNSKIKEGTYVVIRKISGDWVTLVMSNGTDAYIQTKDLEKLPYDVNIRKAEPVDATSAATPASRALSGSITYRYPAKFVQSTKIFDQPNKFAHVISSAQKGRKIDALEIGGDLLFYDRYTKEYYFAVDAGRGRRGYVLAQRLTDAKPKRSSSTMTRKELGAVLVALGLLLMSDD